MAPLVQSDKHGVIKTADTERSGFCVIKFISEVYMLQNNTKIYGQLIFTGELVVKAPITESLL